MPRSAVTVMVEVLSLFIVSDLHCIPPSKPEHRSESLLHLPSPPGERRSPLEGLIDLVEREDLKADFLVCCGDLTNRAVAEGFALGWAELERVATALAARALLFTPGNHDIDVMDVNGQGDPLACLKSVAHSVDLRPKRETQHDLIEDGFEIYGGDGYRIVNIDTNGRNPVPRKAAVGHLDLATIDTLEATLRGLNRTDCYLVLCHHHPYRHGDIDLEDYSAFEHAPEFLAMIERLPDAAWYIVHGHKHFPRISTVGSAATVFSAGSLAGTFYGPQQCVARNQCYLLTLCRDESLGPSHPPVMRFRAWDWAAVQWVPARDGFNIPRAGGMGARVPTAEFSRRIAEYVLSGDPPIRQAVDVASAFPELRYLLPQDVERCVASLYELFDVEVLVSRQTGDWLELGRRTA
jgi:predicted phosphodiesterase